MPDVPSITIDHLLERYQGLLLDAYGVLVHLGGPLPGAVELIERLNRIGKPYWILTNDASRLPRTWVPRFAAMGFAIAEPQIITSGSLLRTYFATHGLRGERCVVLGTEDSRSYVAEAGGQVVEPGEEASTVVACDEAGYSFVEVVDRVLSGLFRRLDRGEPVHLVLPNPDLVYPKGPAAFGFTAGCIARLLEAPLHQRYPAQREALRFVPLGKPHRPIFEEAVQRAGTRTLVMIGDQLGTDIRGAREFGLDAVLAETGLDHLDKLAIDPSAARPSYVLHGLSAD